MILIEIIWLWMSVGEMGMQLPDFWPWFNENSNHRLRTASFFQQHMCRGQEVDLRYFGEWSSIHSSFFFFYHGIIWHWWQMMTGPCFIPDFSWSRLTWRSEPKQGYHQAKLMSYGVRCFDVAQWFCSRHRYRMIQIHQIICITSSSLGFRDAVWRRWSATTARPIILCDVGFCWPFPKTAGKWMFIPKHVVCIYIYLLVIIIS